ncbi:transglycosylase SLT domain-containing protein [Marinobacter panjinensis]|uniref:transglycosylase SLT domain-containing protein n=1 Tax=Marinobacter panjinensis TaxID=2576384 RepID=UPI0026C3215A
MNKSPRRRSLAAAFVVMSIIAPILFASEQPPEPADNWTSIVRSSPYWVSQGVYHNIITIRRWVLKESGYCSDTDRHILFDMRGQFLGYIDDESSREGTQKRLNDTRRSLAASGRAENWAIGGPGTTGYPFALACDQPHVNLDEAVARYLGTLPSELIWGAWDDLSFASQGKPEPLHDALMYVYGTRQQQQRNNVPATLPKYLAGQVLIESSGQQRAHSTADAKGILQLSPSALSDCQIKPSNHWHRLAQIDCALRLMNQNARNLQEPFDRRFGELPADKRDQLFTLLLVQAYHGGAGRVEALLDDDTLSRPAAYFAREHENFSAGDIAFGMVFHNLGRDRFGLASLYYVADVQLATEALCSTARLGKTPFCE